MIKKIFNRINEWMEDGLRGLLGRLTPDRRIILIVTMFLFFSALSIYMTVSSIYNMGKKSGQQLQIEHIEHLKLEQQQKSDSINQINKFDYE
jgi:hypothetical protein